MLGLLGTGERIPSVYFPLLFTISLFIFAFVASCAVAGLGWWGYGDSIIVYYLYRTLYLGL